MFCVGILFKYLQTTLKYRELHGFIIYSFSGYLYVHVYTCRKEGLLLCGNHSISTPHKAIS